MIKNNRGNNNSFSNFKILISIIICLFFVIFNNNLFVISQFNFTTEQTAIYSKVSGNFVDRGTVATLPIAQWTFEEGTGKLKNLFFHFFKKMKC